MKTVQDILDMLEAGQITPETKLAVSVNSKKASWAHTVRNQGYVKDPGQWYGSILRSNVLIIKG